MLWITEITKLNTTKCKSSFPCQWSLHSCQKNTHRETIFHHKTPWERYSKGAVVHTQKISAKHSHFILSGLTRVEPSLALEWESVQNHLLAKMMLCASFSWTLNIIKHKLLCLFAKTNSDWYSILSTLLRASRSHLSFPRYNIIGLDDNFAGTVTGLTEMKIEFWRHPCAPISD